MCTCVCVHVSLCQCVACLSISVCIFGYLAVCACLSLCLCVSEYYKCVCDILHNLYVLKFLGYSIKTIGSLIGGNRG